MPNKKNIKNVAILSEKLSKAKSVYFTNYLGLSVSEVTSLRKKFFENDVEFLVVKNTLLKIASSENKIKLDDEIFSGSTAIALSYDEPVEAAKIIKNFLKDHDLPSVKGIFFEGSYLEPVQFDKIVSASPISADHRNIIPYIELGVDFERHGVDFLWREF